MNILWRSLKVAFAWLLGALGLVGALWVWTGTSGSLATVLTQATPFLPAGQSLEFKDVTGSLREGGRIGWLRWQRGELTVEARQISVGWALRPLLNTELRLNPLTIEHLRIEDHRPASAPTPPTDLGLPLKVDAPFAVNTLEWAGSTPLQITQLAGHYAFDLQRHTLNDLQGHFSSGIYNIKASLQAQAPMALSVQLDGSVQTQVPKISQPVPVQAHAEISGELAGRDAVLALTAQLRPELTSAKTIQAQLSARLQPWQTQPIVNAQAQWQALDLAALWPQAPKTQLNGKASVTPDTPNTSNTTAQGAGWRANISLTNTLSGPWQQQRLPLEALSTQLKFAQGQWTVDALQASGAGGHVEAQGQYKEAVKGQLSLTFPGISASLKGQISSTSGQGELQLKVSDAALATQWLQRWPGMAGVLGATRLEGSADLNGHWQGGWQGLGQSLKIQAQLQSPQLHISSANAPPAQTWRLRDVQADLTGTLRALSLSLKGQAESNTRRFAVNSQAQATQVSAGVWQAHINTAQLSAQDTQRPGLWTLQLGDRLTLDWKKTAASTTPTLAVAAGSARLTGPLPGTATLNWQAAQWSPQQWHTEGRLQNLPLAWLELLGQTQMANLGLRGDLLFGGQWNATGGKTLRVRATLERTGGDLQLLNEDSPLSTLSAGVREARLTLTADGETLATDLSWNSERAGQAQAKLRTRLQFKEGQWLWPADAPVSGTVNVQLPPVGAWSLLAPPGWRLRGTLNANATLSGTRQDPQWRGNFSAQDLAVRSVVDGIDFSQGTLRASLEGQRVNIDAFTLQGAGGSGGGLLSVTGSAMWLPPAGPDSTMASRLRMTLEATAQSLRVSTRADRRLVVSGQLSAQLINTELKITGTLKADQALFILPEESAPQLGDDVVVRSTASTTKNASAPTNAGTGTPAAAKPGAARITPDVNVTLDLGPNFSVRGLGLSTRLAGTMVLKSTGRDSLPTLNGDLRTVRGTFKAYGQQLNIEEGLLRFTGPLDNPALNILAIRPNLQQRVGVQISGTALSPVVRLYSDPELPEAEKLAWLVLGRSGANGGAESAMLQQAALALLGGKGKRLSGGLTDALGLDELSMRTASTNADGSSTGAAVTLGKRISRDIYVTYERSLAGTLGTFYIFYDLSRRITLRAQTGEQSAVDLIFTLRYD